MEVSTTTTAGLCAAALAGIDVRTTPREETLGVLFDAGLADLRLPLGHGGRGAGADEQRIATEELALLGVPGPGLEDLIGRELAAPTLAAHGTVEQQRRWLRPLFTGQELWCQLFSEPGAGSDLAALATRAEREGDAWRVNGQKVWTSMGHLARWGLLLARTDPDAAKHAGLTYFVVDMTAPGVEVRPLRQITGENEFNEVILDDVLVPDDQRIDEVGAGWRVAMTTLANERGLIGGVTPARGEGPIARALQLWGSRGRDEPALRARLAELWSDAEALRLMNVLAAQSAAAGEPPGPAGSVGKVVAARLNQRTSELCLDLLGPRALEYGDYDGPLDAEHADQHHFLRSRANSIEGGTTEVMLTIIGERILGLPPEPRVDKGIPWSQAPRS